jgi:hypothetical protein
VKQRAVRRELDDAERSCRTAQAIAETTDVDVEEAAERNADGGLVRDQENPTGAEPGRQLIDESTYALRDRDRRFASGGRIPRGVRCPADVVVMELQVHLVLGEDETSPQ